ncbi:hypothetical protein MCOR27_002180 [Pyricularia oryzae]|uniref:Uncharacterized protein n=2 Tax=Pyricularia TaxID=48558 RepID=A0ABQ8NK74_PYRGI|nr:hypothetical protein MCOR19_007202 [Pyricularia oryzae]KAI6298375.1 hypothetical protein MCOR33_005448 [Pyricularia grisea]KAI6272695.1 hypothetical protein MCOR26_007230 [Pyricularia oryzae]KAI6285660.1 hypothetical protein MCOR27_002180 [Pyricularia oryzae]KAI6309749.1 hypothetical protein MCOR30_011284 [Pyricularia oryzae]
MSADTIIPLHEYDCMPLLTTIFLTILLKYDRVLDPEALRKSLIQLIDRDGWRKLGARLKQDAKGNLVYHVPAAFDESNPAITFTHIHHDMAMADHPLARQIPSPTSGPGKERPAVVLDMAKIAPLTRRSDAPHTMAEFIARDLPQLELHVVTFRDGTTVGISFLHSLLDGMALGGLLSAWSLILHGRADEVPAVCGGGDDDALSRLRHLHNAKAQDDDDDNNAKTPAAPVAYKHARYVMGRLATLRFVLGRAWEFFRYRQEEVRAVRVPGSFVTRMREATLQELAAAAAAEGKTGESSSVKEKPWVSEGDVLVAWWSRYATLQYAHRPDKPIIVTNAFSMRKALAGTLLPALPRDGGRPTVYLANCVTGLNVYTTIRSLTAATAQTAAAVRRSIVELGTLEQLAAMHALCLKDPRKLWKMRFAGLPTAHMAIFTNWTQALFHQVDLAPAAVAGEGWPEGQEGQVVPSFVGSHMNSRVWPLRDQFVIIGKDSQGDYWLSGTLRKGLWANIEQELDKERL